MTALGGALRRLISLLEIAAALLLAVMMMATVTDVTLRSLNPQWRFGGVYEIVELMLVSCFYFALPAVFLAGANITIDIVTGAVPKGMKRVLGTVALAGAVALLAGIGVQIVRPALDTLSFGEITMVLGIPKFAHWMVVWVGIYLSLLAAIAAFAGGRSGVRETAGD